MNMMQLKYVPETHTRIVLASASDSIQTGYIQRNIQHDIRNEQQLI